MNTVELRNALSDGLSEYLGRPVILSDQTQPEPRAEPVEDEENASGSDEPRLDFPFMIYTPVSPYNSIGGSGNYLLEPDPDDDTKIINTRIEEPTATYSFVACSMNREENGVYIYGDDEAQALSEKAQGWFLHVGYDDLSAQGIVVVEISSSGNRTTLDVDEAARRYGFDVRVRYSRVDEKRTAAISQNSINIKKKE